MSRKVMQQALDALIEYRRYDTVNRTEFMGDAAIAELRAAIAQPLQPASVDDAIRAALQGIRSAFEDAALAHNMDLCKFETGYSDCNTDFAWIFYQIGRDYGNIAQPVQPSPIMPKARPTLPHGGFSASSSYVHERAFNEGFNCCLDVISSALAQPVQPTKKGGKA